MADYSNDALIIRDLVDKWVIYSDAGDWNRFHPINLSWTILRRPR
jgi:hypothetical protein